MAINQKDNEDFNREARQLAQESRQNVEDAQWLLKQPAFQRYVEVINKRGQEMAAMLMQPLSTRDQVLLQEYNKGALFGFLWASGLASAIVASDEQTRRNASATGDTEETDE